MFACFPIRSQFELLMQFLLRKMVTYDQYNIIKGMEWLKDFNKYECKHLRWLPRWWPVSVFFM